MRNRTTLVILIAAAMTMMPLIGAVPAWAQLAAPTMGVQYNLMTSGEVGQNLHGVAVDFDMPIYLNRMTLAAGGAFVRATGSGASISQTFMGTGPGIRHNAGRFDIYAHALFGYRRDAGGGALRGSKSGFDARLSAGFDYPLNERYSFRAGGAYGGNAHVTVGFSRRF